MRILLAILLLWPLAGHAKHMDVYAAYCQNPNNPKQVRLVGMLISRDGETLMRWNPDQSLSPDQQQTRLEAKVAEVVPDWETHMFVIKKAVVGVCERPI